MHLDFETRSAVDLSVVGAHVYATHPSTSVLCASYSLDGVTVRRWRAWAGEPMPADMREGLKDKVHAWNANFERLILWHVVGERVPIERFRCTMARARSMALPGRLELCAKAFSLPVQKANNSVMLRWCRPMRDGSWASDPDEYERLCEYCDTDVRTEIGLAAVLRDMSPEEWRDYRLTEEINDIGLPVDLQLAAAAQHYAGEEMAEIRQRLAILTGNEITSPKQHARIKAWVGARIKLPTNKAGKVSLDGAAREALLQDLPDGELRELLQLVHDGGRASTAKFAAMQARAGKDARVRGAYVFDGAGQTGRFSSTGLQVHNMVREKLPDPEAAIDAILRRAPKAELTAISGHNVLTTLSRVLRPSIVADEGKCLVWGDWSAIEARVLPWLSNEKSADNILDVFRRGSDIYKYQALKTFNLESEDQVTKDQRQACKVQILSLGFGGGVGAFQAMARNYGLRVNDETADMYKRTWRKANPWAQAFWAKLEYAALEALRTPGEVFPAGRISYLYSQGTLWAMLPSGRMIAYPFARREVVDTPSGGQTVVTAIKGSFHPAAGSDDWPRMRLWGGFQAENVAQAEAASLLRWGIRELHDNGWPVIGHTHDEILMEVPEDEVADAELVLRDVMTKGPAWADGLPLAAEISSGPVYGK